MTPTKTCRTCAALKPLSDFPSYTHPRSGLLYRADCRSCRRTNRRTHPYGWDHWAERFLARVERFADNECWVWPDTCDPDGYGTMVVRGVRWRAHRLSYALHYGELPDGLIICHHCDNRPCVNPSHLYAGTHLTNARDRSERGRSKQASRKKERHEPAY